MPSISADEAAKVRPWISLAEKLGGNVVVKAQVLTGGRGKAGGIKLCRTYNEVRDAARDLLGKRLVTLQTGPEGKKVKKVLVEEGSAIEKEFYLSMLVDRGSSRIAIVVSTEGGMDIEKVAHDTPEKITRGYASMGPYRVEAAQVESTGVYTNLVPACAFRGFGIPQMAWAHEAQMERVADRRYARRQRRGEDRRVQTVAGPIVAAHDALA